MTPFEFGRQVKIAAETGGFGEWLGQGFDNGAQRVSAGLNSAGEGIRSGLLAGGNALGRGIDSAYNAGSSAFKTIGGMLPTPSPGYAAGGMGGMASTGAGAMQRMQMPQTSSDAGPGLGAEPPMATPPQPAAVRPTPRPAPRPAPRPRRPAAPVDQGPGLSDEVPTSAPVPRPAAVRPTPRPAAVRPAPVQPKPTAPGVRKPGGRVA
jgi:translation initiation factor IF-2